jgi:hypothetical protein
LAHCASQRLQYNGGAGNVKAPSIGQLEEENIVMRLVRVLVVAAVLMVSAIPVLAQSGHTCPHHNDDSIAGLRGCVEHALAVGHIDNPGVAQGLFAKLDAAQAARDRGKPAVAVNKLNAFIHLAEAQAGKHIDATHAGHMVEHAQRVIAALQSD